MKKKKDIWVQRFEYEVLPTLKKEYAPLKMILFGSRIKGTPRRSSDIDVIIVSKKFSKIPFVNRMSEILQKIKFPKHVDYIYYTPEEFKDIVH
ncbi:nucleotidyltransferase domain-containing protein [bacterium]|nr:nucleotidyltransferase domain-containing protein [bacterium]